MTFMRSRVALLLGSVAILLVSFQNCSPASFSSSSTQNSLGEPGDPDVPVQPCHDFQNVSVPLNILVAIDNSGSTGSNIYATAIPNGGFQYVLGSDNDQIYRQRLVHDFVDSLQNLTNITYNLSYFQDLQSVKWRGEVFSPIARALINVDGNNQMPAFGDAQTMRDAMAVFRTQKADGATEYFTTLELMRKAIVNHPKFNDGDQSFAAVFLSDGQPTERIIGMNSDGTRKVRGWNSDIDVPDLLRTIRELVGLLPGRITFSTIFFNNITPAQRRDLLDKNPNYDPVDPGAPVLLSKMAKAGNGQFANANIEGQDNVKLNNVITVPSDICAQ